VPRQRRLADEPIVTGSPSLAAESYRALRTSLRFLHAQTPLVTVVITSAGPSEGKTTVAANLAVAIGAAGERVVLVDADLRRPRAHELFHLPGAAPGVTEVVLGQRSIDEALVAWNPAVSILPAGSLPTNPSEVLGSEGMASVLADLSRRFDVVILDAPPVLPVTDSTVLSALVDGVVLVARWGATKASDANEARAILDGVGANVVGVVLNGVRGRGVRGYYGDYRHG
jgi:capsular exopolysaccharide synthesis family protein